MPKVIQERNPFHRAREVEDMQQMGREAQKMLNDISSWMFVNKDHFNDGREAQRKIDDVIDIIGSDLGL